MSWNGTAASTSSTRPGAAASGSSRSTAGYQACGYLRSGRLLACLAPYAPDDRGHYLCYQSRRHLPARIRVFVDDMTLQVRALDLHCLDSLAFP